MSDQLELLGPLSSDLDAGRELAKLGMDQALAAQRVQTWKLAATQWLRLQAPGTELVADDLVAAIGLPDEGPARNNVVGAWFSAQAKARRLVFTGKMRASARIVRHGNAQRVWRVT